MSDALFAIASQSAVPSELTRGPWVHTAQHGGPPSALLMYLVETTVEQGWSVARMNVELLAPVPLTPLRFTVQSEQLSRRVAVATAHLLSGDVPVAKCTSRLLATSDATEQPDFDAIDPAAILPGPEAERTAPTWGTGLDEPTFHRDAVRYRWEKGDFQVGGPATVWHQLRVPVVADQPVTGNQRLMAVADIASGVSAAYAPETGYGLINSDLDVAFVRAPQGEWIRTDAITRPGPGGTGLCTNVMSDIHGVVATGTQTLLGRPFNLQS